MVCVLLTPLAAKPATVSPYNHPDYKHTLDDALDKLLTTDLHYSPSHRLQDIKMLLGYIAGAFAAFGSYESYTKPFHSDYVMMVLYGKLFKAKIYSLCTCILFVPRVDLFPLIHTVLCLDGACLSRAIPFIPV